MMSHRQFNWPLLLQQIRVTHWIKNLLILIPLVFSNNLTNPPAVVKTAEGVVLFSLLASSVYILNDLLDLKHDRLHPVKKLRPIASGAFPIKWAFFVLTLFLAVALVGSYVVLDQPAFELFVLYYLLNIIYSTFFKAIPPLDIIIVAIFYLIRPAVGAASIGVTVSSWLIITTFFIALYFVSLKRWSELINIKNGQVKSRKNIDLYTVSTLQTIATVSITVTIVSYAIYASGFPGQFVFTTIPIVALCLRIVMVKEQRPTDFETAERVLLKDPLSLVLLLIWSGWVVFYHWR